MKLNAILGWLGTACSIVGSSLVASNSSYSVYGFIIFLAGSSCNLKLILSSDIHKSILATTIYFMFIDIYGIINFWENK